MPAAVAGAAVGGPDTAAALAADLATCLGSIGEPVQAIKLVTGVLRDYEPWRVRARCVAQIDLACTHFIGRDLEQAAAVGRDALRTAAPARVGRADRRFPRP
ncbi:MAG: hypothetical protein ACRDQX_03135 [Pseudonocardiaceae bacterium]